jgi:hypothetical protein
LGAVLVLQADDPVEDGGAGLRVGLVGDEVAVADELETVPGRLDNALVTV